MGAASLASSDSDDAHDFGVTSYIKFQDPKPMHTHRTTTYNMIQSVTCSAMEVEGG